jgi:hypothetical protein
VPERAIVAGDPAALLVTLTLPFKVPVVVGSKITPNVRLCEGFRVAGVAPLSAYPVPLTVIEEICTLELPVFVIVSFCVDDDPVFTLPNPILAELNESVRVGATPVPLNATVAGEFGALLTTLTVPDRLPAVVGAKVALKATLAPGATVLGMVRPLTV